MPAHPPASALASLRHIARALSAAWDLDTTLDLIARTTTDLMGVDSCAIYLLDAGADALQLRASTGLARQALGRATLRVGEGMTGHAVAANRPVFATEAQDDPLFKLIDEAEETAFHSLLAVPLVIETRPIGALNVQTLRPHAFTPEEIELLSLIGDLAAGALAKAQLYDSQRRQIEELGALARISEAVTAPQYLDDMLDVVTDMAARTMNAAVCSIFLLDERGAQLELRSAKRTTRPYRHRPPLPLGEGIAGRVARDGVAIYVPDVRHDPRYRSVELARQEGLVSLLAVPLSVRDRVIGVFNCYTAEARQFTPEQRALLQTLANQTALAIENVRLVTSAAIVREMHHRIKNNLQTVAMLMQLQLPDAEQLDTRHVLETNINRIRSIAAVHEALSERSFRLVDVRDMLERVTRTTISVMAQADMPVALAVTGEAIQLPSRAATALALVVNELVQNAVEHGLTGSGEGAVSVSLGRAPEEIVVVVRDDGRGMPAAMQPGLGLEIVATLVREELRGQIEWRDLAPGTEAVIRMPRSLEQFDDEAPEAPEAA